MKNIYKAIAGFQQECPTILKETKGYGYQYADLPTILEVVNPLLKKYGMGFTQLINENNLTTIIFHIESGETIQSVITIPEENLKKMNKFQVMGSAITYLRRYSLSAMLGIVSEKDTDAAGTSIPKKTEKALEYMSLSHEKWESVKEKVAQGVKIEDVEKYYNLSDEAKKELKVILTKTI